MAEQHALKATVRTSFGKGFARRLRAAGQVPGVVYGHGGETQHVALPAHELTLLVRHKNVVIELDIDGKKELVLVKDIQKDHVRQILEHADLVIVKKGETVTVDVPVVMVGHSFPGTVAMVEHSTLTVEAEALHIPEHIEIDVTDMHEHTHVSAKDVKLPQGVKLHLDPETIVVAVQQAARAASVENEPEHVAEAAAAKAHEAEAEAAE
ncbi:MAG: 50S ribosomal protein L25/general stress protein Ctc [Microbacteriaceae bacterium]